MANNDNIIGFKFYKPLVGGTSAPPVETATLGGTVAAGDPLSFSSGTAVIATASDGDIGGVAMEAGTSGDEINFIPSYPWCAFKVQTASGTDYATATHLYNEYDITGTTGAVELDLSNTTEKVFRILGLAENASTGEHAKVWGVFTRSSFAGGADAL